jgi:hypothetical protein
MSVRGALALVLIRTSIEMRVVRVDAAKYQGQPWPYLLPF